MVYSSSLKKGYGLYIHNICDSLVKISSVFTMVYSSSLKKGYGLYIHNICDILVKINSVNLYTIKTVYKKQTERQRIGHKNHLFCQCT